MLANEPRTALATSSGAEFKKCYDPRAHGADCNHCPLRDRVVVPPDGSLDARLAIVGEAPGFHEEQHKIPFVGPSGALLNSLLRHHGIDRASVWVTNATLCKPPDLKIGSMTSEDPDADPRKLKLAMACCRPRLERELEALKNLTTIVPLGAVAHRAVVNKHIGIQKARGFVWSCEIGERLIKVLPTVHPAFVLRAPAWEPVIAGDFERAVRAEQGRLRPIKFESHLGPEFARIKPLLARLGPVVSVDVETTREPATRCLLLCVGISDGRIAIVVPWASTGSPSRPFYGKNQTKVARVMIAALANRIAITHNGPGFDQIVLARHGIELERAKGWDDTLIAHHAFASHFPQRLDHVVSMYLDAPPWKLVSKKRASVDEKGAWDPTKLKDEELWGYNAEDCVFTARTWRAMGPDLDPERSVYESDKILALLCRRMQEAGVAVDRGRREVLRRELLGRQNYYLGELRRRVGFRLRPTRLDHIRKALFRILHAPILFRSIKTGAPSTDVNTLQALAVTDTAAGGFCRTLLKWREAWKLRSTYVDGIDPDRDGRVHPSWKPYGTVSGRLSCREPNLQNLKRGSLIRTMYCSPRGRTLVGFDLSQLEMRMAAYLSGDENFIEACETGDLHENNAKVLFGELPPKGTDEYKKLRTMAKTSGFAVSYMAQASTVHARLLADGFRVELRQVEAMLNRMRRSYRGYYDWQESNLRKVAEHGFLRLAMSGRKRWFGTVPIPTEVANYPIQGGAADLMNTKLPEIEAELPRGAFIVAQIHDAAIIECAPGQAKRIARLCKSIVESEVELGGRRISFPAEVKVGQRWSEV